MSVSVFIIVASRIESYRIVKLSSKHANVCLRNKINKHMNQAVWAAMCSPSSRRLGTLSKLWNISTAGAGGVTGSNGLDVNEIDSNAEEDEPLEL